MAKRKVLIGVAWPYVNGTLHIGHLAGYLLPADICARYQRITGNDVLMVSGSDCFGTPITVEADKRGVSPKEIVDEYHEKDVDLFLNKLDLSYDLYTKTDTANHAEVTQDIFIKLMEEGYIFVDSTNQYYSTQENRFLPDRYVVGTCPYCGVEDARSDQCDNCGKLIDHGELKTPRSNLSGGPVELKETQHYFADWSKLQPFLEKYVDSVSNIWKSWVKSQTKAWLKEGLRPRAITRDLDWGVPLPVDRIPKDKLIEDIESKRIYVWFEAVIGYLSASKEWAKLNNQNWESFWYDDTTTDLKHYYFMGKDNLVFHALFWPGQLHIYESKLHLPDVVSINMFLNLGGKQFSKSRGVVISIADFVEKYGNDAVRFYLTLIMPEVRDSSFSWSDFEEKNNGILVGNLGNFIHRVLSLGKNEEISSFENQVLSSEAADAVNKAFLNSKEALEECRFRDYLDIILDLSQFGNKLVDKSELWTLKGKDETAFYRVMYELYVVIIALAYLMYPLMPEASSKLFGMFGLSSTQWPIDESVSDTLEKTFMSSTLPSLPKPLFNKIEVE